MDDESIPRISDSVVLGDINIISDASEHGRIYTGFRGEIGGWE